MLLFSSSIIYDGQIIIIIEGLHYFTEFGSKRESEIKFWLPKYFPKRIRVIVTASKNSKTYANLLKRKCQMFEFDKSMFVPTDVFITLSQKSFLMPEEYNRTFLDTLKEITEECYLDRSCVKGLASAFCPYETKNIYSKEMADMTNISKILYSIDFASEYFTVNQV